MHGTAVHCTTWYSPHSLGYKQSTQYTQIALSHTHQPFTPPPPPRLRSSSSGSNLNSTVGTPSNASPPPSPPPHPTHTQGLNNCDFDLYTQSQTGPVYTPLSCTSPTATSQALQHSFKHSCYPDHKNKTKNQMKKQQPMCGSPATLSAASSPCTPPRQGTQLTRLLMPAKTTTANMGLCCRCWCMHAVHCRLCASFHGYAVPTNGTRWPTFRPAESITSR